MTDKPAVTAEQAPPSVAAAQVGGAMGIEGTILTTSETPPVPERVSAGWIWLFVLAMFGAYTALVAPIGISLSIRVQQLAPENVEVLGYIIGIGASVAAVWGPILGMVSDRTRSRFGRRRPYAVAGAIIGVAALGFIAWVPSIPLVVVGWVFVQIGFSSVMGSLMNTQADRLPEEQRGKVAGLSGFVQMLASISGVGMASAFIGNNFLVFLVPGFIGLILVLLYAVFSKEPDSRNIVVADSMTLRKMLQFMVFNPAKYPDFAWNWLGRLIFMIGVTFATTFTTLFYASRLSTNGRVEDIGALIVILSLIGVVSTAGSALAGGILSDKLKRRRIFILSAGIAYTIGAVLMAFGGSNVAVLIIGSIFANVGLGVFSAVDQAIVLDVLPESDTAAGRFIGINGYSTSLAQVIAPVAAAPLLLIGVTGADKNYGVLLLVAAACTLVGGTIVLLFVRKSS
ncbi:MFS transporter [Arthrobacter sp. NQ7]|uniref:MFS transporter n=1 Tax=Arthrobacter sp. NQ7 TaxID=3032303 RepID=UPI0024106C32|nr:MFS transporter [Arthrobacter sp. NQ7]MDJ0458655.1 MFS transporter [Arthrobacter sp. NQ7]